MILFSFVLCPSQSKMAIQFTCSKCGTRLQVRDEHLGKRLRCPNCKNELPLGQSTAAESPLDSPRPSVVPDRLWYVTTENGEEFGPVTKAEVDSWVTQGLITARAQLCQQGDTEWRWASDVYPQLAEQASPSAFTFEPQDEFQIDTGSDNPYASPRSTYSSPTARAGYRRERPHRGGMILTFGILGLVCCGIFSIMAWVMGAGDLKQIRHGRMDRNGEGLTQAGMICGIIGVVLNVLSMLGWFLLIVAA
jgi:hypothetical protein